MEPLFVYVDGQRMQVRPLLTEEQIQARNKELAALINQAYAHLTAEPLVILIVLHGAILFAADLVRELAVPTLIESTRLRSYQGMKSTGKVEVVGVLPDTVNNHHVLIVEDIVDSGRSLAFLIPELQKAGAKSVRVATLLDKPEAHEVDIRPDFVGFSIGKNFVIGYGLDLDGKYRNLPYIGEVVPAPES